MAAIFNALSPAVDTLHLAHGHASDDESEKQETFGMDMSVLKDIARRALINALNSVNGAKTLVLDPSLAGPLGLVTEVSLLRHHGVDKIFWLESGPLSANTTNIVYLCRPQIRWMKIVAEQIKALSSNSTKHAFTLLLVPRRTILCDRVLEEEGVFGEVTISAYDLGFIPVEEDFISLEWENTYREIFLDGDTTAIFYAAQALMTMQKAYGLFPRIMGKGDGAKKLANLLVKMRPTSSASADLAATSSSFDSLIIIDRSTDLVTPMLTQLTYEGLLDELFGIKNAHIEVDPALLSTNNPSTPSSSTPTTTQPTLASVVKKKKHHLSAATDGLLTELRGLNFSVVGGRLHKEAKRLSSEYEGRHQARTVGQLKEFVGKLGGLQNEHQALRLHTGLSEQVAAFTRTDHFNKTLEIQQNLVAGYEPNAQLSAIEDLIAQQAPVQLVLRLLCLANLTMGGIKAKVLENLKREVLQTYGYNLLPLLLSLSSLSLLTSLPIPKPLPNITRPAPPAPSPYPPIQKAFRLLSDTAEAIPTDISYTYSGYAPLSIRLVQCVAQKGEVLANSGGASAGKGIERAAAHPIVGWKGFEDIVKIIPGELVDEVQGVDPGTAKLALDRQILPPREQPSTTMVFFLGGCTYTEIAALRWMGKQSRGRQFLIATTGVINGSTLLESIGPNDTKFSSLAGP